MRARTPIYLNVQRPVALFGLAPELFAALLGCAITPLLVLLAAGWPGTGLLSFAVTLAALGLRFRRWSRQDLHFCNVRRAGWRFHGIKAGRDGRILQAGGRP